MLTNGVACQHAWTGWDGSQWDLTGGTSGLKLQAGVRGVRMPPVQRYSTKAPAVAGSIYRGSVTDERDVFWPLKVFSDVSSQAFLDLNARFFKTLDPERVGIWSVTQPGGAVRRLACRFVGLADEGDGAPELWGRVVYGINLVAERPYWLGAPVGPLTFSGADDTTSFFSPAAGGVFYLASSFTQSGAAVTNPGDVPVWPVWTFTGPASGSMTSATVGVNGHLITLNLTLGPGQSVTLDTDPTNQVPWDQAGVDRSSNLTANDFEPIPVGADVPLTVLISGGGSVSASFTPAYYQAA